MDILRALSTPNADIRKRVRQGPHPRVDASHPPPSPPPPPYTPPPLPSPSPRSPTKPPSPSPSLPLP
jgi:hypothetical protein